MNLFEYLVRDATIKICIFVVAIIASILATSLTCKMCMLLPALEAERFKEDPKKYGRRALIIVSSVCTLLIAITAYFSLDNAFNRSFSDVAKIAGPNTVSVNVNDKNVKVDLGRDKPAQLKKLSNAISQVAGQSGFEKIIEIKQISETRYEITYKCTCGKIEQYVSSDL